MGPEIELEVQAKVGLVENREVRKSLLQLAMCEGLDRVCYIWRSLLPDNRNEYRREGLLNGVCG